MGEAFAAIRTGNVCHYDAVRQKKDGHSIDVAVTVSPIRNPAGDLVGASVIVRNIGERVQADRKLRESEERFLRVFEHAPFGTCLQAIDGRFLR
jgi:PAS domain-containing protein